jgi:predicted TPR repeat methyltransferase
VGHRTTGAESAVAEYILQRGLAGGANVLHVGVGNGDFGNRLRSAGAVLQGVSISGGEISNARGHYTTVHLVNKYDADALASRLDGSRFDWIVDVNLFSYTCCWGHAIRYFWLLVSFLAENGKVISHASGSAYAPTGFCLTPSLLQQLASAAETTVVFKGNGVTLIEAKGKGRQCRPDGA